VQSLCCKGVQSLWQGCLCHGLSPSLSLRVCHGAETENLKSLHVRPRRESLSPQGRAEPASESQVSLSRRNVKGVQQSLTGRLCCKDVHIVRRAQAEAIMARARDSDDHDGHRDLKSICILELHCCCNAYSVY
jgi:hypothetical protein